VDQKGLEQFILNCGATLVNFADLGEYTIRSHPSLSKGVSIAVRLSDTIIDDIREGPTKAYAHLYRTTNHTLDQIALRTTNFIQSEGYKAHPIPASLTIDRQRWRGTISHKMVATRAGMGWIGKNALLITPQHGPSVRLVSVLTDAPLKTANPIIDSNCGECRSCVEACPSSALRGKNWSVDLRRKDLMEVNLCAEETHRNEKLFGNWICGICISVCPFRKKHEI